MYKKEMSLKEVWMVIIVPIVFSVFFEFIFIYVTGNPLSGTSSPI